MEKVRVLFDPNIAETILSTLSVLESTKINGSGLMQEMACSVFEVIVDFLEN